MTYRKGRRMPRYMSVGACVLGLSIVSHSSDVKAQQDPACSLDFRGGVRFVEGSQPVEDGSPIDDMDTGYTMAAGGVCPVTGALRLGVDAEGNMGPNFTLVHFLAGAELPVVTSAEGATAVALRGQLGWTLSADGYEDSLLIGAASGRALQDGTSGPALGAGLRLRHSVLGPLQVLLDASWRIAFLEETVFDPPGGQEGVAVHVFPVTIGLAVSL